MKWNGAWRVLAGVLLVLVLGGPAPGAVGSCEEEDPFVNAVDWCVEKGGWLCQRQWVRGEFGPPEEPASEAARDECLTNVQPMCQGASWPAECVPPTRTQTDACIAALSSVERLSQEAEDLVECKRETLCGGGA